MVKSIKDISNVIISHFDNYPLLTQKRADLLLFKSALNLINEREYHIIKCINKIIRIRTSMNFCLSDKLKLAFPNIISVQRPVVQFPESIEPN
jgi:hypothetical protein